MLILFVERAVGKEVRDTGLSVGSAIGESVVAEGDGVGANVGTLVAATVGGLVAGIVVGGFVGRGVAGKSVGHETKALGVGAMGTPGSRAALGSGVCARD